MLQVNRTISSCNLLIKLLLLQLEQKLTFKVYDMHFSLQINAAIETLLTSEDPHETNTAAREIIAYGDGFKSQPVDWEIISTPLFKWPKWFRGNANDVGNIDLKEETDKDEVVRYGTNKDRIGHYRIWKLEAGVIKFHHFWKSSLSTESSNAERPDEYYLFYDPQTKNPMGFGKEFVQKKRTWKLFKSRIIVRHLGIEMIFGRAPASYESRALYPK